MNVEKQPTASSSLWFQVWQPESLTVDSLRAVLAKADDFRERVTTLMEALAKMEAIPSNSDSQHGESKPVEQTPVVGSLQPYLVDRSDGPILRSPRLVADVVEGMGRTVTREEITGEIMRLPIGDYSKQPKGLVEVAIRRAVKEGLIREVGKKLFAPREPEPSVGAASPDGEGVAIDT